MPILTKTQKIYFTELISCPSRFLTVDMRISSNRYFPFRLLIWVLPLVHVTLWSTMVDTRIIAFSIFLLGLVFFILGFSTPWWAKYTVQTCEYMSTKVRIYYVYMGVIISWTQRQFMYVNIYLLSIKASHLPDITTFFKTVKVSTLFHTIIHITYQVNTDILFD
jgi:hypothetical protein